MEIYEQISKIFSCNDFFQCAEYMMKFVEMTLKDKNRKKYVDSFYEFLCMCSMKDYTVEESKNNSYIYDGCDAINNYIYLSLPIKTTPAKSLNNIQKLAEHMTTDFLKPIGKHISIKNLLKILNYINKEYDFSKRVFKRNPTFSIFNVSSRNFNNEVLFLGTDKNLSQHFFLYAMNQNGINENVAPEAVLFHEFGHALHAKYTGNINIIPKDIISTLKENCFPTIDSLSSKIQAEILADILSVGLMFDSPFEKYDPFAIMHKDDKKLFKKIAEKFLNQTL